MTKIHQIYCTHCTHGSSALERRDGDLAQRTLGYSARAGSLEAAALRQYYRQIERYLYYYLPRDTPGDAKLTLSAATAPRRLVYLPAAGGVQFVGQICYRQRDSQGRPGSYFGHVMFRALNEEETGWSAGDCLRLWHAPGWVVEDGPDIPFLLPPLERLDDPLQKQRPAVDDAVLRSYLITPAGGHFDDPGQVVPLRWRRQDPHLRQRLLAEVLGTLLEIDVLQRQSLLLVVEPELAALLFYGALRLLPKMPWTGAVSFSTFEPNPEQLLTTLTATHFYDPTGDLRPEDYRGPVPLLNTFTGRHGEHWRPQGRYAGHVVARLVEQGWGPTDRYLNDLYHLGARSGADLERWAPLLERKDLRQMSDADLVARLMQQPAAGRRELPSREPELEQRLQHIARQLPEPAAEFSKRLDALSAVAHLLSPSDQQRLKHWQHCREAISRIGTLQEERHGMFRRRPIEPLEKACSALAMAAAAAMPADILADDAEGTKKTEHLRRLGAALLSGRPLLPPGPWLHDALWNKIQWCFQHQSWLPTPLRKLPLHAKPAAGKRVVLGSLLAIVVLLLAIGIAAVVSRRKSHLSPPPTAAQGSGVRATAGSGALASQPLASSSGDQAAAALQRARRAAEEEERQRRDLAEQEQKAREKLRATTEEKARVEWLAKQGAATAPAGSGAITPSASAAAPQAENKTNPQPAATNTAAHPTPPAANTAATLSPPPPLPTKPRPAPGEGSVAPSPSAAVAQVAEANHEQPPAAPPKLDEFRDFHLDVHPVSDLREGAVARLRLRVVDPLGNSLAPDYPAGGERFTADCIVVPRGTEGNMPPKRAGGAATFEPVDIAEGTKRIDFQFVFYRNVPMADRASQEICRSAKWALPLVVVNREYTVTLKLSGEQLEQLRAAAGGARPAKHF